MAYKDFTQEQKKRIAMCKYYIGEDTPPKTDNVEDVKKYYFWEAERMFVYESTPIELAWMFWNDMKIEDIAKKKRPDIPLDIQYYLLEVFDHILSYSGSPIQFSEDTNHDWGVSKYLEFISNY